MTRLQRIQKMTAMQLAEVLINTGMDDCIDFCKDNPECNEEFERTGSVTDGKCKQCLAAWLEQQEIDQESADSDVTPQLAAMACNIIRQYCLQQETCTGCAFGGDKSLNCSLSGVPGGCWPDLEIMK